MEDNTCPVCHEIPSFFAIGRCDHPICFKCSTRMRVLCEQMYCAICRSDLPEVLFVRQPAKFSDINRKNFIPLRRHRILFQDFDAEEAFKTLQEIRCRICKDRAPDRTFKGLKDHMRKDHTLFYCDLCLEHTKLFAFERKFYNRKDLATHRRTGDADDTSYKGHPLCKFCDERYMDNDELLRHLRKDHYFCHFCDGDGSNEYYNDYEELNKHFEQRHFVCKLDDCIHKKFTNAFRSNIDLKAHIANEHNQNMTKQQAKEARTLDVNFQFAPRMKGRARGVAGVSREDYEDAPSGPRGSGRGGYRYRQEMNRERELREQIERAREESMKEALRATEKEMREVERKRHEAEQQEAARLEAERIQNEIKSIEHDFPSLSGAAAPPSIVPHSVGRTQPVTKSQNVGKPQTAGKHQTDGKTNKKQTKDNNTPQFKRPGPGRLDSTEYPSLGGTPAPPPSVTEGRSSPNIQVVPESILRSLKKEEPATVVSTRVPKRTSEDFPTLGGGNARKSKNDSNVSLMSLGVWSGKSKKNEIQMDSATRNEKPQTNVNSASLASLGNSLCQTGYPYTNAQTITNTRVASPKLIEKSSNSRTVTNSKTQSESTVKVAPPKTRDKQPPAEPSEASEESKSKKNKKKKKQKEQKEMNGDRPESAASGKDTKSKKSKLFSDQNDRDSGIESSSGSVDSASLPNYQVEQLSKISESSAQSVAETSSVAESTFKSLLPDGTSGSLDTIAVGLLNIGASSAVSNGFLSQSPLVLDDFPSLNSPSTLASPPPGFNSSAPPGFGGLTSGSRPPPGFSSGSTLKAPLSAELDNFVFSKPAHFGERNKALVQNVSDLLKNDQDQFGKFKAYSGSFRQGSLDAVSYYHNCQDLLGQEDFSKIIPELIALLPDIDKQQELLSVHKDALRASSGVRSGVVKISGKTNKAPWSVATEFKTCPTCRQVLVQRDYDGHLNEHSGLSDFPTLGGSGHNPKFMGQGSWIKAK